MKPMTPSIVSAVIITVFGGPSYLPRAHAQDPCLDPTNPDCISTNSPGTNDWTQQSYPSNALQWSMVGYSQYNLLNAATNRHFLIEQSTNLINWSLLIPAFTNLGTTTFTFEPTNELNFFRAKDVTFLKTPSAGNGTPGPCPGAYIGHVTYNPNGHNFCLIPRPNEPIVICNGGDNTNIIVQTVGSSGDIQCGPAPMTIEANPYSSFYGFTVYFYDNLPTNPYPMTVIGADIREP